MFCPGCGAANQTASAYCKRCGEWLPDLKRRSRGGFGGDTPQQNILTGLIMSALSAAVALFSAVALYATYLGTNEAKWSIYLAGAFCLCIAGWQLSSFVVVLRLWNRLNRAQAEAEVDSKLREAAPPEALPAADLSNFVSAESVTENTTELLQPLDRPRGKGSQSS